MTYAYAHPDGRPEQSSLIKLYDLGDGTAQTPILEVRGTSRLQIPDYLTGQVRVSVTPNSGERSGNEYFSDPVEVIPMKSTPPRQPRMSAPEAR